MFLEAELYKARNISSCSAANYLRRKIAAAVRRQIICKGKSQRLPAASRMRGEAQLFLCDELHKKGKSQLGLNWNHISDSGLYENHIIIYVILPLKKTAQHFTGGNPAMQAVLLIMRKID